MTDIEREAWKSMGKKFLFVIIALVAAYVWYWLWVFLLRHVFHTPLPMFDAIWFSIFTPFGPLIIWKGLKEWHKHEVESITSKVEETFNEL